MSDINILFALEAEEAMLSGDYELAIKICEHGISLFPNYISAYSIYLKSLMLSGEIHHAKQELKEVLDRFALTKDIEFIKAELDKFPEEPEDFADSFSTHNSIFSQNEKTIVAREKSTGLLEDIESDISAELETPSETFNEIDQFSTDFIVEDVQTENQPELDDFEQFPTDILTSDDNETNSNSVIDELDEIQPETLQYENDAISTFNEAEDEKLTNDVNFAESPIEEIQDEFIEENIGVDAFNQAARNLLTDDVINITVSPIEEIEDVLVEDNTEIDIDQNESIEEENETVETEISDDFGELELSDLDTERDEISDAPRKSGNLRLINYKANATNRTELRAGNLRVVPGLEFSQLKIGESNLSYINHLSNLPEPPEWGWISNSDGGMYFRKADSANSEEDDAIVNIIYTETMAKIYEQQGAFETAKKVYLFLAETEPERQNEFLEKADTLA